MLLGSRGTAALVVAWRRLALGVLAAAAVLYGPYVYRATLFQRGAVPEALGLGLLPWLPFGAWQTWRAETPGRQTAWLAGDGRPAAALLLTHTLVARRRPITLAWTVALPAHPAGPGGPGPRPWPSSWAPSRPAWLPAAGESGAVQLEIGREGHLDPRAWLLDLGGNSEKQQSAENRQTPGGPLDLHLFYPHQHQFVVTLKPGLAQGALALLAVLALALCAAPPSARLRPPPRPRPASRLDSPPRCSARRQALLASPFLALALVCWALLFTFSEPLWRLVPALSLLQWPGRLLGPFGYCVAIAGAGGLGALWTLAEGRPLLGARRRLGPGRGGPGPGAAQRVGRREVPYYPDPKRTMDGRMIVQEEKDSFSHIGTTSGGVHPGRRADRRLHRRAAPGAGGVRAPLPGARVDRGASSSPSAATCASWAGSRPPCASACAWSTTPRRRPAWGCASSASPAGGPGWTGSGSRWRRLPTISRSSRPGWGSSCSPCPRAHAQPGPRAHPLEGRRDGPVRPRRGRPGLGALLGARRARLPSRPHAGPAGVLPPGHAPAGLRLLARPAPRLRPAVPRPRRAVDGVFGPPPGSGALLVNLAAARANGQARVSSPTGPAWAPSSSWTCAI